MSASSPYPAPCQCTYPSGPAAHMSLLTTVRPVKAEIIAFSLLFFKLLFLFSALTPLVGTEFIYLVKEIINKSIHIKKEYPKHVL